MEDVESPGDAIGSEVPHETEDVERREDETEDPPEDHGADEGGEEVEEVEAASEDRTL